MSKVHLLARLAAATRNCEAAHMVEHRALLDALHAGASLAELGRAMGISRQTVRHRINAARAAIPEHNPTLGAAE